MDTTSGSSKYYSVNNPWKNVEMHKAVPDANGYPYVLQRFTNEPQGRVRETGLAGDTLITGGRRSTLYYYGTPLQEELDRLLGNNAGYASYYTKTLIRDPNGGWMSEIKDLTGKVVISSMERRGSHLLPLQDTLVYLKSYLIQRDSGGWHDGLAMDSLGDTYQKTLVLPGGDVDWGYYLQVPTYQDACLPNICMDCAFDWKLKIQSSCGTDYVAGHSAASKKMGYPAGVDTVDVVCDSTTRIIAIDSVRQNWDGGEVHITRELSLNTQALQQYFQEYLKNNKCIKSYEDFLAEEMSKIDSSLCHLGCADCVGSTMEVAVPVSGGVCAAACDSNYLPHNVCDKIQPLMLMDVSPGGQYATYTRNDSTGGITSTGDMYSVFSKTNSNPYLPKIKLLSYNFTPAISSSVFTSTTFMNMNKAPYEMPLFFDWQNNVWRYYYPDAQGKQDTVWLSGSAFTSNSYLIDTTKKWWNASASLYFTFPQYLKVEEFIDRFKPSWAEALLVYHPEYVYLWECRRNVEVKSLAGIKTFAFDDTLSKHPEKWFNSSFACNVLNQDPFFASTDGHTKMGNRWMRPYDWTSNFNTTSFCTAGISAYDRMFALMNNYHNSGLNIFQVAYAMAHCASTVPASLTCSSVAGDTAVAQQLSFLYSSLKQEVVMEYLHKRSMKYKAYNGVIGPYKVNNPSNLTGTTTTLPTGTLTNSGDNWWLPTSCSSSTLINFSIYGDPQQISNSASYAILHLQKEKRWGRVDELMGLDTSWYNGQIGQDTAMVVKCRCPKAETLNTLLQLLSMSGDLLSNNTTIDSCSFFNVPGLATLTGATNSVIAVYNSTVTNNGQTLLISLGGTCTLAGTGGQIQLDIPPSTTPPIVWNDTNNIVSLQNLQYLYSSGNVHHFTMSLWYKNNNDSLFKAVVNGKTCMDITCPKNCDTSCVANNLFNLVKYISTVSGGLNNSYSVSVSGVNPLVDSICKCFIGIRVKSCGSGTISGTPGFTYHPQSSGGNPLTVNCNGTFFALIVEYSKPTNSLANISINNYSLLPCVASPTCCSNKMIVSFSYSTGVSDTMMISFFNHCPADKPLCLYECLPSQISLDTGLACSDVPPIPEIKADSLDDGCLGAQLANAQYNATLKYEQYIDSVKKAFVAEYVRKCKKVKEYFWLRMPKEGNYDVVYLYDQVGNLLQTVPPEGVNPLSSGQIMQVQQYRNTGVGSPVYPAHTKASEYRYNSANLQVEQKTPDGGVVRTYYDLALRAAASQNERMADSSLYGYVKYDYKGRVIESGVGKSLVSVPTPTHLSSYQHPNNWLGGKREVVRVVYDKRYLALPGSWLQKNLRGRVSYQWRDEDGNGVPEQVYAYDYDALGNVGNLYVYVEDLKGYGGSNGWKRVRYEYDLVSKKVKYVGYQEGQADQWLHRYRYDGMNRLVDVQTSRDGWYWERDAWYKYYLHRVLGRVMLGERLVQGLDKVYTINGWVKGENAWRLDSVLDLGQDGRMGGMYQYVAKDVMGYELKYFSGDYKAVGLYNTNSFSNFVSLYNGNIAMSVLQQDTMEVMGRKYRYDALNRLRCVDALMGVGFTAFNGYRERFSYDRDGNITRLTRYAKASMMDSLKYNYYAGNNRLECVNDVVSASSFTNDIDNQGVGNYKYDKTGNLVEDVSESIRIHWTYYNKVKQIDSVKLTPPKYGLVWATKLRMKYDALGNRVVKENPKRKQKEIYIRDAQGNILALYQVKNDSLYTKEFYMYGSQRLGYLEDEVFLGKKCIGKFCNIIANPANPMPFIGTQKTLPTLPPVVIQPMVSSSVSVVFGKKRYEISDWLGNVRVVINDRKTPVNIGTTTVGYKAQVVSVSDYYSFGSEIAERSYEVVKPLYRFGFQAQEKDNEIYGKGNTYYFKFREHDARIGRFWSVDPLAAKYPWNSPYALAGNDPITSIDLEGRERSHYLLSFSSDGKPQLKFLCNEDIVEESWSWSTFSFKTERNQRKEYVVHTGIFHTGVINGNTYNQEITFFYHSATEFVRESKLLSREKIQEKEAVYGIGDKIVAGLENIREENRSAGGVPTKFSSGNIKYLYHYSYSKDVNSILKKGLVKGDEKSYIYMTDNPNLTPIQAQIELALPANRPLRDVVIKVDVTGLTPIKKGRVQGNLPKLGAGGGTEYLFDQNITPDRIKDVKKIK
jgi:RHS repeat-associated protein